MNRIETIFIPSMSARAFTVRTGQVVRVIDVAGHQPGDLVIFKTDNRAVKLSQARSRVENGKITVTQGDQLWTNSFPPEVMVTIIRDTHGSHDLLYTPCCRYALKKRFGITRDGCLENLVKTLAAWNVKSHELPDPLNLFFRVVTDKTGRMKVGEPISAPGSSIDLHANMDCLMAVSTCPVPRTGRDNSGYCVEIYEFVD